ncbi:SN protein, partial [Atractosteus spatula]|nr:SN protein [Atractosteus spatula]
MGVEDSLRSWGATLLILPGVLCGQWAVWYPERPVCAVRGSSVVFNCSYDYPESFTQDSRTVQYKVDTVLWCKDSCSTGKEKKDKFVYSNESGSVLPEYLNRTEYLGDKQKTCTVKIKDIRTSDQGEYRFRFETNDPGGKWSGVPGVTLSVSEFKVWRSPSGETTAVREGDSVTLTCDTGNCSPAQTQLTWFKNDQPLPHTQTAANTLHFNPVSSGHSGLYSCAPRDTTGSRSPPFPLDVQYAPKGTSVSISPSGAIAEGSSVTLTCSSSANPPVKNYSWFKINGTGPLYKGPNYTIINISSADSGQYYCEAQNEIGALNSTAVNLTVTARGSSVLLAAVLGSVLLLIAVSAGTLFALRRRTAAPPGQENKREAQTEAAVDHLYGNVTQPHTSERQQGQIAPAQETEVNYSTVNFKPKTPKNDLTFEETEDSSVLYSTIVKT